MQSVSPQTYLIGYTTLDRKSLARYLKDTDQAEFLDDILEAEQSTLETPGLSGLEILCSFYAKLCYKALASGHNANLSRTRDIRSNVVATLQQGHGSVFEHVWLNFITTGCSRIFTHELVRHRVGTAFSQTSGRYVRSDTLDMVLDDPILKETGVDGHQSAYDVIVAMAGNLEANYAALMEGIDWDALDFATKKKLTSALRRILPNGQANEIGWSMNVRALRHVIQMRTSRHAEWEIRKVFHDVFHILQDKYPLLLEGAAYETIDGLVEVTGMKV